MAKTDGITPQDIRDMFARIRREHAAKPKGKPEIDYSGRIGALARYEPLPYSEDEQGRRTGGHGIETWNDHGRTRDLCRYCQGKHDFNDCEAEPYTPPVEPRRPTIKEAFALDHAVFMLDVLEEGK